jgi:hypothetical protein
MVKFSAQKLIPNFETDDARRLIVSRSDPAAEFAVVHGKRGSRLIDLMHVSAAPGEKTVKLKRYHCQPQRL